MAKNLRKIHGSRFAAFENSCPARFTFESGRQGFQHHCPTNGTGIQFVVGALASWLAIDPLDVTMVTIDNQVQLLNALIDKSLEGTEYSRAMVTVLARFSAGKRKQRARGLEHTKGSITVFVDDDVFWQPLLL